MSEGAISEGERGKVKSCDPEFKLFGRRIPVVYASESADRSSESTDSFSSEVTKIKSSSDDSKSSSDSLMKTSAGDEKASVCGHRNEGEMSWDESRSSLENKFRMDDAENFNEEKLDGETHFQERGEKNIEMEERGDDQKSGDNVVVRDGSEESNKTEQGTPKKPNKVVPCPRCESMDTKFCYYNNYNVNQPRHFCRNCQRYWTAGGLLRNVPVGAGRRKNKHSVVTAITHQRDLVSESRAMMGHGHALSDWPSGNSEDSMKFEVSELQMNGFRHDVKKGATKQSGAFVGLDETFQKSTCSSNQIRFEKGEKFWNTRWISKEKEEEEAPGEFRAPDDTASVSVSASSNTKSVKSEMMESYESSHIAPKDQGGGYELPNNFMSWVNGPPPVWPLYCGSFFGNSSYMNGMGGAMLTPEALQASAMMPWFQPGTGLCPGFPWPFPSAPIWGQASWGPAWGMPLRPVVPSAAVLESTPSSSPSPAMLGKHTRDLSKPETEAKGEGDGDGNGSLWVPKTLRIDDPEEAAKSSIWSTLGLGSKPESITSGGIFKAFQPKTENNDITKTAVNILRANPAASTRSATFNENT